MEDTKHTNERPKIVITHSGSFHADDICAVATIAHFLGGLDKINIVRTRDEQVFPTGDFVVDVGGVYDPSHGRFDHHQTGGAGERQNGIPYASFGLVWKEYGEKICGSQVVAEKIDTDMVAPIDADDSGFSIVDYKIPQIADYRFQEFLYSFAPTWKEKNADLDTLFNTLVVVAYDTIAREIKNAKAVLEAAEKVLSAYEASEDKRIIILEDTYPWRNVIQAKPEPLFVVYPENGTGRWNASTVRVADFSFSNRKDFPKAWGGLRSAELEAVSGVKGALFCHTKLFFIVADSKEAILQLVKIALDS